VSALLDVCDDQKGGHRPEGTRSAPTMALPVDPRAIEPVHPVVWLSTDRADDRYNAAALPAHGGTAESVADNRGATRVIVADVANLREQVVLTPNMEKGLNFLLQGGHEDLSTGRVLIDDLNVYAEVQAYDTIDGDIANAVFEGHRKYIDMQYVVSGDEIIGWASANHVTVTTPYVPADDYWLGTADPAHVTPVRLTTGQLAVLYPDDPHAPRQAAGAPSPVKKIVVKVAIDT
jgi:biofilm protein TabA